MAGMQDSPGRKAGRIQFADTDEPLDIRYDSIFKAVFTRDTPASKGALSGLISALIGRKARVQAIATNEPPARNVSDRRIRFDIACKAESGELINIEMSFNPEPAELSRLEYYAARQYSGQEISGGGKGYSDLADTFQIAIIGTRVFFPDCALTHTFQYYDPACGVPLGGKSRIVTVELLKAEQVVDKPAEEMDICEEWSVFFEYLTKADKRAKINEILEREEEIAMAGETLIHISRNEIEQARLTSELKYVLDTQSRLVNAKRQGMEEGIRKIAKKMKAVGKPVAEIKEFTGLSEDDINHIG